MASVFLINPKGDAILRPEVVKLTEYLSKMDKKILLYIILSKDYTYGPFHKKPPQQRDILSKRRIWKTTDPPDFTKIKDFDKAVDEYESLIFDMNRYKRDSYLHKIENLDKSLKVEESPDKIGRILKAMDLLEDRLYTIERKISLDDEVIELGGGRKISYVEQFIHNRKEFIKAIG